MGSKRKHKSTQQKLVENACSLMFLNRAKDLVFFNPMSDSMQHFQPTDDIQIPDIDNFAWNMRSVALFMLSEQTVSKN